MHRPFRLRVRWREVGRKEWHLVKYSCKVREIRMQHNAQYFAEMSPYAKNYSKSIIMGVYEALRQNGSGNREQRGKCSNKTKEIVTKYIENEQPF